MSPPKTAIRAGNERRAKNGFLCVCALAVAFALQARAIGEEKMFDSASRSVLRFDKPADVRAYRLHAMPLGNGQIGAMVSGGVALDVILLNHDRLRPPEYREKEAAVADRLPRLRELALAGKWRDAQRFFDQMKADAGGQRRLNFYHPAADLLLESELDGDARNYARTLDLASGVGRVRFDVGDARFERTYFVSAVDGVFVTRLAASKPGRVNVAVSLGRLPYKGCALNGRASAAGMTLTGSYPCGLEFAIDVRLRAEGGSIRPKKAAYRGPGKANGKFAAPLLTCDVRGADALTILVAIQVTGAALPNRPGAAPRPEPRLIDFEKLLARHLADHRERMGRVALRLGPKSHASPARETVAELIAQARQGEPSPRLCELVFDMGRYVLLASSRPGSEPANLQGLWSDSFHPAWQCRYQLDMNLQMNYWLADVVGLPECSLPLFDFVDGMAPAAERFARDLYGCRGMVFPVGVDGLNVRYPSNLEFVGVAGWLAQHYWEHYLFTLDRRFLAQRAYPFLKRVAAFYEDFLFKRGGGRHLLIPSNSPENNMIGRGRLSMNATIDVAIAKEVLTNAVAAAEILGEDEDLRPRWRRIIDDLPDWPIGKDGALREWGDPTGVPIEAHRHLSHLYPLFPGYAFTPENTPKLVDAAVKAMQKREAVFRRDACGWSYAWLVALYARAGRAEDAYRNLAILLRGFFSPETLLSTISDLSGQGLGRTRHGRLVQVEAGLGAAAGIAEMLVQSHAGLLRILPALPQAWPSGEVRGLRARGGLTVDVEWADHCIQQVRITGVVSTTCRVKFCRPAARDVRVSDGEKNAPFRSLARGVFEFRVEPGRTYTLLPPAR